MTSPLLNLVSTLTGHSTMLNRAALENALSFFVEVALPCVVTAAGVVAMGFVVLGPLALIAN